MKTCPYCAEAIQDDAKVCKHCGRDLTTGRSPTPSAPGPNPGTAAVLSFLVPGLGQMYSGRIVAGLVWLLGVVTGYVFFIIPGLVLHVLCVFSAYSGAKPRA